MVKDSDNHLEVLAEIRTIMERSSRFISLSGLSGVAAGTCALLGAIAAYIYLDTTPFAGKRFYYDIIQSETNWGIDYLQFFFLDAGLVLAAAVASGIYFTTRKAQQRGEPIWDASTQRLLVNLSIPLVTGGIFVLALIRYGLYGLVAPSTLIFYGLALINGSKYTINDIRYLGICEIILGVLGLFFVGFGLELWALGFGVLHILYGIVMYIKYER
ncbi:MAG: hypothetical protein AAGH79_04985 [Bacteroidota bacterium]